MINVILENGIVTKVLTNEPDECPLIVVVDIDKDHEDYEKLCDYRDSIITDMKFREAGFMIADFKDDR